MATADLVHADPWVDRRRAIEEALGALADRELGPLPAPIGDAIRYALTGGKRIRGILLLAAYEACGRGRGGGQQPNGTRSDGGNANGLAAAVEVVHAYSLVHDDLPCMDDDDFRRGRPSVHKAFGVRAATVAGIVMVPLAVRATLDGARAAGLDHSAAAESVARLMRAAGAGGMIGGQLRDLVAEGQPMTVDGLDEIHRGKTGALIAAAAVLGGLAGRANPEGLARLDAFGMAIGLAFQITDDVLDVTGTSAALGKTAGRDMALNKSTYPALVGVANAEARARGLVDEACAGLGSVGLLTPDLRRLAHVIVDRQS
jgi:geranylgeranyl diphosphate synthase, type II